MGYPSTSTPLTDLAFVAFDTETTGLSPVVSKLVELSGVKFNSRGEVLATFSQLIDPETTIPPEATQIHGITNQMVKGQPTFATAIPAFFEWLGAQNTVLIAHNAPFDLGFLEVALARLNCPAPPHPVLDTLSLARRLIRGSINHQLKTLVEHLKLDSGQYHRALADSHHVRDLFLRLLPMLPEAHTWEQLSASCDVLFFNDLLEEGRQQLRSLPDIGEPILEAIDLGQPVHMIYRSGRIAQRMVTPHSVQAWRGRLYLNAYCHVARAQRSFRLDKIVSLRTVEDRQPE